LNAYILLAVAITGELFGSSMLKASDGFKRPLPSAGVVTGYVLSFYFFSLALKTLPLGPAYAIWAGVGTALTAVVGALFYKENMNARKVISMGLIICGVILMRLSGGSH
jgi:multidrug resistance protein EbrA